MSKKKKSVTTLGINPLNICKVSYSLVRNGFVVLLFLQEYECEIFQNIENIDEDSGIISLGRQTAETDKSRQDIEEMEKVYAVHTLHVIVVTWAHQGTLYISGKVCMFHVTATVIIKIRLMM